MVTPDPGRYAGSHAVLIGVSAYEDPGFPPIRAARNSLNAMYRMLADPALCGWPPERITTIANPLSRVELAGRLADIAEQTTGVLLVYYVGHGVITPLGQLCLTVTSTDRSRPKISGLPWEDVTEITNTANCPAQVRVAILDCCFAGQGIPETLGGAQEEVALADAALAEGVYTLTATIRNKLAHVVPAEQQGESCTTFTGELCEVVRKGIEGRESWLTLGEIYPVLRYRLQSRGMPLPNQRGTNTADKFRFTANAGHADFGRRNEQSDVNAVPGPPQPIRAADRKRAAEALEIKVRAAHVIRDDGERAQALAELAQVTAEEDPDRAARLYSDAERAIESITDALQKMPALCALAKSLSTSDPDRAELVAQDIPHRRWKALALAEIVKSVSSTDPDRAARLFGETMRGAQYVYDGSGRMDDDTLAEIALVLAATDRDRAEHAARTISDTPRWASTLLAIAQEAAGLDPDYAAELLDDVRYVVESVDGHGRGLVVARLVRSLVTINPGWAELIALSAIDDGQCSGQGLLAVAVSLWAIQRFDAAERVAGTIASKSWKSRALSALAREAVSSDLDRAERIAQEIPGWFSRTLTLRAIARSCAAMAE